jgi:hypothetical protein
MKKYSPFKLRAIVRRAESLYSEARLSKAWVVSSQDEDEGGWLNGRPWQTREGDVCVTLNGISDVIIGNVHDVRRAK